jgi:hypothetical protein
MTPSSAEQPEIEFTIRTPNALPPAAYAHVAELARVVTKLQTELSGTRAQVSMEAPKSSSNGLDLHPNDMD